MAFVVETGDGLTDANAYISVAYFIAHFTDRGRADEIGDIDNDVIQAGIVKATDFVDKRFGKDFLGYREKQSQSLAWPRLSAMDDDGYLLMQVPSQVQKACAEYAYIAIKLIDLLPVPAYPFPTVDLTTGTTTTSSAAGPLTRDKKRVEGAVETEKWYSDPAQAKRSLSTRTIQSTLVDNVQIPAYPVADLWLEEVIDRSWPPSFGRA